MDKELKKKPNAEMVDIVALNNRQTIEIAS